MAHWKTKYVPNCYSTRITLTIIFMRYILFLFLLCSIEQTANAQITITSSDIMNSKIWNTTSYSDTSSADMATAASLIARAGANQTWDLSHLTYQQEAASLTSSQLVPYSTSYPLATDAAFSSATHVVIANAVDFGGTTVYEYLRMTNDGLWFLGVVMNGQKLLTYSPPDQSFKFPLTYQTQWSSNTTASSPFNSPTQTNKTMIADAWGTVVIPASANLSSTSFPAIRVKTTTITITAGQGAGPDTSIDYNYDWYTQSAVGASIAASSDGTPNSITYNVPNPPSSVREIATDAMNMRFSQNPTVGTQTNLFYTTTEPRDVTVQLMDLLGNNVRTLQSGRSHAGVNMLAIDESGLTGGTYFVRLSSGDVSTMQKLVIAN
jgi:hypothetical protein